MTKMNRLSVLPEGEVPAEPGWGGGFIALPPRYKVALRNAPILEVCLALQFLSANGAAP